jgi:hypothetical protein
MRIRKSCLAGRELPGGNIVAKKVNRKKKEKRINKCVAKKEYMKTGHRQQ